MSYQEFLAGKFAGFSSLEFERKASPIASRLFPFQSTTVDKLLGIGRGAAFLDTGMGKTAIQIEWARQLNVPTLIVCPLAVADQTINEAAIMDVEIKKYGGGGGQIQIVNYDRLHLVDTDKLQAVVFDESSIMKSLQSKTRELAERIFSGCKYRLACSATPAPNDYLEIGQQSQVLGVMRSVDMLSRWFVNDSAKTGEWRLKRHATKAYWSWIDSWAAVAASPADLGDTETDMSLPPLYENESIVDDNGQGNDADLFGSIELSATGIRNSKRLSLSARVDRCRELAADDYVVIWCDTNDESEQITNAIEDAEEVRGSMTNDEKERRLLAFADGDIRVLVTKPSIAGFGMNWQHCNRVVFAGATYSFERYYQAVRRCWRFGQKRAVTSSVVMTENERLIWFRVKEKAAKHKSMIDEVRKCRNLT